MKTADLTGRVLSYAVAKCEGWGLKSGFWGDEAVIWLEKTDSTGVYRRRLWELSFSEDWELSSPIIEREGIFPTLTDIERNDDGSVSFTRMFRAKTPAQYLDHDEGMYGPTPLLAAMRCFVASKLGNEVDVPKELM